MINIVMIHSVFWTGQSYAPAWTRDLALLVDVPLFFFLSGWAVILQPVGWKRTIHGTLAIYVNYAMIVALVWAALAVVAHRWVPWTEARNWFVFTNLNSYEYPCVLGSAWFLSAFIIIRLLTPVLARLATGSNRDFSLMLLASVAFLWMSGFAGSEKPGVFGLSLRQMAFLGLFYFLGLSFARRTLSARECFTTLTILATLAFVIYRAAGPEFAIQLHKFPPDAIYLAISLMSVTAVLWLKGFERQLAWFGQRVLLGRILAWSGKNCIALFAGQGFGAAAEWPLVVEPLLARGYPWSVVLFSAFVTALAITYAIAVPFAIASRFALVPIGHLFGRASPKQAAPQPTSRIESRAA
jgi:surface polysaccharide O-acyltransferase-like enzyme